MKRLVSFVLLLFCGTVSFGQTPAPAPAPKVENFSVTANAISLPGKNSSTLAATLMGVTLQVTPNLALRQTDFMSSGAQTNAYFGGIDYTVAPFSKFLNNLSPNLNGYDFKLQASASVGASRLSSSDVNQHFAFLVGGRLSYAIKGSSTYSMVVELDDFNSPGLAKRNNLVVAVGPKITF